MGGRKHDLLAHWYDRHRIDDVAFRAGRRFERMFEQADMAGHASIDLVRPKVDGKPVPHATADAAVMARTELLDLRHALGAFDFSLVCRVIGQGRDLCEEPSEAERKYLAHRIRDALGIMAVRFALDMVVA